MTNLTICRYHGCVAVQACSWLLELCHPLGHVLIGQHVCVAAFLTVVHAKGVAGEQHTPARVVVELLKCLAASVPSPLDVHGAAIAVELSWEVLAPFRRVN